MESLYCLLAMPQRLAARCGGQHEQDVLAPRSSIELFQEHPPDIPPVSTTELIRMDKAVTLLVWPVVHVVTLTQNHLGGLG